MKFLLATVVLSMVLLAAGCCCHPDVATQIKQLKRENATLQAKLDAAHQQEEAAELYTRMLSGDGVRDSLFAIVYPDNELARLANEILPYSIPARDFDKKLRGEIIVERMTDFELLPGNRIRSLAHIRGVGIDYRGNIPDAYKAHVSRFKAGIARGAIVKLESVLVLDARSQRVAIHSRCLDATLKKNSTDLYENQLVAGMNQRALRKPIYVSVAVEGRSSRSQSLLVTGNQVVVIYRP